MRAKDLVPLAWLALFRPDDIVVVGDGEDPPLALSAPVTVARATFDAREARLRARLSEPLFELVAEIARTLDGLGGGLVEAPIDDTWARWRRSLRPDLARLLATFDDEDPDAWARLFAYIDADLDAARVRALVDPGRAYDTLLGHPAGGLPPYPRDAALWPDLRTAMETLRPRRSGPGSSRSGKSLPPRARRSSPRSTSPRASTARSPTTIPPSRTPHAPRIPTCVLRSR